MEIERYYFPVNLSQIEDLLGKMLTQIEAMNLRESVETANKSLVRQRVWKWFEDVQENSLTSYRGCIAPIYSFTNNGQIRKDNGPQTNRWGYMCSNGCHLDTTGKQGCSECPPTKSQNEEALLKTDTYDDSIQDVAVELPEQK